MDTLTPAWMKQLRWVNNNLDNCDSEPSFFCLRREAISAGAVC